MYDEFKGLNRKELERQLENLNKLAAGLLGRGEPIPEWLEWRINVLQVLTQSPKKEDQ